MYEFFKFAEKLALASRKSLFKFVSDLTVINLELHQHFISTPLIISNFLNRVCFIFAGK